MDHEWFGTLVDQHPEVVIAVGGIGFLLAGSGWGWPSPRSYQVLAAGVVVFETVYLFAKVGWPFDLAFIAGWLTMTGWCVVGALLRLVGGAANQ